MRLLAFETALEEVLSRKLHVLKGSPNFLDDSLFVAHVILYLGRTAQRRGSRAAASRRVHPAC
jgi:hypothetical protein